MEVARPLAETCRSDNHGGARTTDHQHRTVGTEHFVIDIYANHGIAADALGLGPGAGAGIVTHHGLVTRQGIEVSVQAYSRIDAEDLRREREDAETAARAAAAVTS